MTAGEIPSPITASTGYSYIPSSAYLGLFAAWREGETMINRAKRYNVSRATISKIVHRFLDQESNGTSRD